MATIEQFNAGIDEMRRDYPIAIIAMYDDGQRTIFPLQRGKGIDSFQATVKSGHYEHVALKFGGRIMAIWHRDSKAAAPAQPAGDFGVGDKVVIRKDAKLREGSYLALLQKARSVGEVVDFDRERVIVEFSGGAADDGISFLPEQLTLWTPAEPGSDAKDYTYPEYVTEFAPEHGNTDKPERKMPFMGTRSNPCCKERDVLIAERDKLLLSEQRYHEEVERLRAAMQEIVDLPEDSFKSAWSIAVAALAEPVNS